MTRLKNTPVLITGIAGFIGSHLAKRLIKAGAKVYGLERRGANLWRIKDIKKNISLYHADLRDSGAVEKTVKVIKPKKIYHLAAYVDVNRTFDVIDEIIEVNIKGTVNLLKALKGINYDCFINTGTCEEYGNNPVPFREDQVPNPVSPYSASKVATTMFCQMLYKTMGLPVVTLRPFLTYGPGQDNEMLVPSTIRRAIKGEVLKMTGGEQTREFNYVEDIVEGFILGSIKPKAIGEIINIGNGLEYKVKDVVKMILSMVGKAIKVELGVLEYRPGEAQHFYCDNKKAKEILGWKPKFNLEEGLKITIRWFEQRYGAR